MNTTLRPESAEDQTRRAEFESQLAAAAALRLRRRDLEAAISDRAELIASAPDRRLLLEAFIANHAAQRNETLTGLAHSLLHKGSFDRAKILDRLAVVATVEHFSKDLLFAVDAGIAQAKTELAAAKAALNEFDQTHPNTKS